jgi:Fe(3+) dicitrate transport protein
MKQGCFVIMICWLANSHLSAQNNPITSDSIESKSILPTITIQEKKNWNEMIFVPEIFNQSIYAGKKISLISVEKINGNTANNVMRQVFAKVPGIHVWESDPSGIQIGVASRGLSPNRSWEFNVRLNGYDIAADPFGYPEAYFNPPLQAVQKIELVRGHGALQYGPQFGGMINYMLKNGDQFEKPLQLESSQTIGGFGQLQTFLSMGGKSKKWNYYNFFHRNSGRGWRKNSYYETETAHSSISYQPTQDFSIRGEFLFSNMLIQQPGGLTDSMFLDNPRESTRSRNWMNIQWMTPALSMNYKINHQLSWNTKIFGLLGDRRSVGFLSPATIYDTIHSLTKTYNLRTLQADQYRNFGMESRMLYESVILQKQFALSYGIRFFNGQTTRNGNGTGTDGKEFDMRLVKPYTQELTFNSSNLSLFIENLFRVNKNLQVIPGLRYEAISGRAEGKNGFLHNGGVPQIIQASRKRNFMLYGIGTNYHLNQKIQLYGNITEAFRPVQFTHLQAPPSTDSIDSKLSDSKGFNADLSWKGKFKNWIQFDISLFYLHYNNRIGIIQDPLKAYRLITNIGKSHSKGIESYSEFNLSNLLKKKPVFTTSIFISYSYTKAVYANDFKESRSRGKMIENAPKHIFRSGIQMGKPNWTITTQFNYVSKAFSDAANTITPSLNGQTGAIPSYFIIDQGCSWKGRLIEGKFGINNLLNTHYFTRRAGGYPGPGILPGDGRNYYCTLTIRIKN